MIINLLRSNYEFLFYLSIFYSIYILYKKWRNLKLINKYLNILNNNSDNWFQKTLYFLIVFLFIISFYFISKNILGFNKINYNEYRIIKLILGFSISIITLFISIKKKGFKSWKTLFSFLSFCILILYASLFFDEGWKELFNEKINSYIIACSVWIIVFISYFSHEYLYMSNFDIVNNLKMKFFKFSEGKIEMYNKPNMITREDLLNKEDSIQPQSSNQAMSNNIQNNKMKRDDLLNKEDSINKQSNNNSKDKSVTDLSSFKEKGNKDIEWLDNLSKSHKTQDPYNIFSNNSENINKSRPSTSDSKDTASIISYDSTISNAHISIVEGTKRLVKGAELFTNQWKEGKILGENDKEKKEMLDEIIDLPDEKVFKLMNWRLKWEQDNALTKYVLKRNMPFIPQEEVIEKANAGFDKTMSNKDEKQKFWTKLKAFVKEPIKDEKNLSDKDLLDKLRKETLSLYIKGEEEAIITGDNIKKPLESQSQSQSQSQPQPQPLEIGGRKFKKGGLIAIYEDKKIEAEASFQQQEMKAIKNGFIFKRILPSYGRLSFFEIMNRNVGSITDDFKKLNIDSSTSSNNNEINTNSVKSESNSIKSESNLIKPQSSLINEVKINNNGSSSPSPILENNNIDMSKN